MALTISAGKTARDGSELLRSRDYSSTAGQPKAEQVSEHETARTELSGDFEQKNDVIEADDTVEGGGAPTAGTRGISNGGKDAENYSVECLAGTTARPAKRKRKDFQKQNKSYYDECPRQLGRCSIS